MSIRDQMFRGYILIRRALDTNLLKPNQDLPILVVGGGVAGVIASLTAVDNGVPVILLEQSLFFNKQKDARHRIVCPTQYDWPAAHWRQGLYPWTGPRLPLTWYREPSSVITAEWTSELFRIASTNPLLNLRYYTKFTGFEIDPEGVVQASYRRISPTTGGEGPLETSRFSLLICCAGFGAERTKVPSTYTGYRFWERDPYSRPNIGLEPGVRPNVLISGAGDGSLQDYIRLLCRKTAGDVYHNFPDDLKKGIEDEIAKIEDSAMRSFLWGDTGPLDHPIHHEVQEKYRALVNRLLKSSPHLRRSLAGLLDDAPKKMSIKLLYPCNHFWSCYALNRFIVLLVSSYIEREWNIQTLHPNSKVLSVRGVGHVCNNSPNECHGQDHDVDITDSTCPTYNDASDARQLDDGPFNIVITRHGIEPSKFPLGKGPSASPFRQVLPYSSVW
jgi:hypothetical protein